jgi:peptidoglycan/xylan/chitin deacetylase (PgdA/CDA1 family)
LRWPTRLYDRGRDWLWTYDSKDWQWTTASPPDVGAMLGKISHLKPREDGLEIVLFHDMAHNQELRIAALRELAQHISFMNWEDKHFEIANAVAH